MSTQINTVNPIEDVIRTLRYTMLLSFTTNTSLSSASTSPLSASHLRFESVGAWPLLSFSRLTARAMLSFSRLSDLTWFLRVLISSLCWCTTFLAPKNSVYCHSCGFSTSYHRKTYSHQSALIENPYKTKWNDELKVSFTMELNFYKEVNGGWYS